MAEVEVKGNCKVELVLVGRVPREGLCLPSRPAEPVVGSATKVGFLGPSGPEKDIQIPRKQDKNRYYTPV